MNIFQAILDRRSIREFKPDPIPEDVLERLLEAMRQAPSGKNAQPWKFIVVKDKILKEKIASACTFFTSSGREINQAWIAQAPVIIVVCGDQKHAFVKIVKDGQVQIMNWDYLQQELEKGPVEWESGLLVDLTIPLAHLSLAAVGEGLGACWVAGLNEDKLKAILGIPADWRAPALMPVGYPHSQPESRRRKEREDVVSFDHF
jgi:nitroreductase